MDYQSKVFAVCGAVLLVFVVVTLATMLWCVAKEKFSK